MVILGVLNDNAVKKHVIVARRIVKKLPKLPKLPIDCVTRWGSTFKMVEALVDPLVISFFKTFAAVNIELYMSEATLESLKDIVRIFKPFHAATVKLQSEQLTVGDF